MLRNLVLIAMLLVIVLAGVLLGIDNQTPMTLKFLDRETPEWPLFWWLCAAFGLGALVGLGLCSAGLLRGRVKQRRLRRTLRQREAEIDRLTH